MLSDPFCLAAYLAACDFAREFNEWSPPERVRAAAAAPSEAKGDRPGDDFNRRAAWEEVLKPHGWTVHRAAGEVTYWTRPDKDPRLGCSATTGKCRSDKTGDLLYVFSTNAGPFEGDHCYDKFGAFAQLNHGGDLSAAAGALKGKGYGGNDPADATRVIIGDAASDDRPDDGVPPDHDFATNADLKRMDIGTKWLWDRWLQLGVVNLLAAEAGLGKTRLVADLCRRLARGEPWPDRTPTPAVDREYLAMWVAGDRNHAELVTLSEGFGFGERISYSGSKAEPLGGVTLNTPDDFKTLYRRAKAAKPLFLVVDTAGGATGFNLSKQEDARSFYAPLSDIAAKLQSCVLVITHLNAGGKVLGKRAEERVRCVIRMTAPDKEPGTVRRLEVWKSNSLFPAPLGVILGEAGNEYTPDAPPKPEDQPGGWQGNGGGNDSPDRGPPTKVRECMDWLQTWLADAPKRQKETLDAAIAAGFSRGTVFRTAQAMNLIETQTQGAKWWGLRK